MTWLQFVNVFFLQFFFIRLTRCQQRVVDELQPTSCDIFGEHDHVVSFNIKAWHYEQWYSIQGWIVPLTGWRGKFLYLWQEESWFVRITPRRVEKQKGHRF